MNAFHVCGALFAIWAVTVAVLGITRENFPGSKGTLRLVAAISLVLAALAIGSAIYVGATKESGGKQAGERSSFLAPL
ncbi:MAG: hypothetical protein ABR581_00945 [Thermoleophilaceae bacterium]